MARLTGADQQQDILPPDTRIGLGLSNDLKPGGRQDIPPPCQPKPGSLSEAREDTTEELLVLTEDAIKKMDGEGFDPYNTKS